MEGKNIDLLLVDHVGIDGFLLVPSSDEEGDDKD